MTREQFIATVTPMHDDMHRLAYAMTGSADDAADAVQEAMMKLWKLRENIPEKPPEAQAYCFRALRTTAITMISRRKPSDDIPDRELSDSGASDDSLILDETQRVLSRIINSLPDNQRIVIRLTANEGCDIARTALLTGLSEVNVRQILSRARRQIRNMFTLLNS